MTVMRASGNPAAMAAAGTPSGVGGGSGGGGVVGVLEADERELGVDERAVGEAERDARAVGAHVGLEDADGGVGRGAEADAPHRASWPRRRARCGGSS